MRLAALGIVVAALILVPFALYGADIERWAAEILAPQRNLYTAAGILAALLAADVFLPVPSSIVSTAAGRLLGFPLGASVVWMGMTAGCLLGYIAGAGASGLVAGGKGDAVGSAHVRYGDWMLALFRPIPVLAEASVLFAGALRVPLPRFLMMTGGANFGISVVYAGAGAFARGGGSILLAFLFALLVPGALIALTRRMGNSELEQARARPGSHG